MIQRIQSIWLLLASIVTFLLFFFPVALYHCNTVWFNFYTYGLSYPDAFTSQVESLYSPFMKYCMIAAIIVTVFVPFGTIFMYKNRSRQIYLSRLTILLNVVLVVVFFLLADSFSKAVSCESFKYGIACYFPIVAIIFLFLAIRNIKKDEKLIRSADRIR